MYVGGSGCMESGQMRHRSPNTPLQNQMFEHREIFTFDYFSPHTPPQLSAHHLNKIYIYKTDVIHTHKNISAMGLQNLMSDSYLKNITQSITQLKNKNNSNHHPVSEQIMLVKWHFGRACVLHSVSKPR